MAKKQAKTNAAKAIQNRKSKNAVVRAPTSISVRATTQSSGTRQEHMLMAVKATNSPFILHCGNMPWLKGVAPSYQKWNMRGVVLRYEPRMSTATNGNVHMAFLQDFEDRTPTTVDQFSLIKGASRAAVWDSVRMLIPSGKIKAYCSLSSFQSMDSSDQNDRAVGRVCVLGDVDASLSADTVLGYIYISYEVDLKDPIDPTLQ